MRYYLGVDWADQTHAVWVGGIAEQRGPIAPGTLLPFLATAGPSATLSPSAPFPCVVVIGRTWLRRFRGGTRRASPVARRVLVIVPSLITPPEWTPRLSAGDVPCCLRPKVAGSASGAWHFRGHLALTSVTAR